MNEQILVKYRVPLISLVLAVVTFIAFEQVRNSDFVSFDDDVYVYDNPNVNNGLSLKSAVWAFTTFDFSGTETGHWQPITWLSHMLDCQLYGLDPAGHHITNLLFHIANTLLLFWVLKNMTACVWPSAFVAALFAIHPLHVESVAWITQRRDILSLFFWILTMAAYNRYARQPKVSKYLLVVLFFAMSLMSKSMSVTLPFVLLLLDYWPLSRFQFNKENTRQVLRLIIEKIPLFILSVTSCAITLFATKHALSKNPFSLSYRISNAVTSYLTYIIKMICPSKLGVLYPNLGISLPVWQIAMSSVILIIISVAVIYWAKKKRFFLVGWLWYLGTLVPVIGLVQIGPQAMADKYTYLPLIGLFIMIAWSMGELFAKWNCRKIIPAILAGLVLIGLFICTRMQVRHWRNSLTLYEHTLAVTEKNYLILNNYGLCLDENDRIEEAIEHLQQALQLNPDFSEAHYNLGVLLKKIGKCEQAIYHCQQAVKLNPDFAKAYYNLGIALEALGKFEQAVEHYQKALQLNPNYVEAHNNLGNVFVSLNKLEQSIEHYQKALQLNPDHVKTHYNLGNVFVSLGKLEQAIEYYQKALQLKPEMVGAYYKVGNTLMALGKPEQAINYYQQALRLKPNPEAHYNLALVLFKQNKVAKAIIHWKESLRLRPDHSKSHNDLAWVLATTEDEDLRDPAEAVRRAKRACELTQYSHPGFLDTLATAYASSGDFAKAIEIAEKALQLVVDNRELTKEIQKHMELYKANKPYYNQ